MTGAVIALALSAALAHAVWNAFLRSGADRLWVVTVMALVMAAISLPVAIVLPMPAAPAWPYLAASGVLQVIYSLFLVAAYRHGDLGQVYPIIRGTVPILVALGAFFTAGERLSTTTVSGMALIVLAILLLGTGRRRAALSTLIWAVATGGMIATYATIDALGVRLSGDPMAYSAWLTLLYAALLVPVYLLTRGKLRIDWRDRESWKAAGGGVISLGSYVLVIAALALGPAGPVMALRETSVVFAALIGAVFLREGLDARRLIACAVLCLGTIVTALS